jgi:hypothetical protein
MTASGNGASQRQARDRLPKPLVLLRERLQPLSRFTWSVLSQHSRCVTPIARSAAGPPLRHQHNPPAAASRRSPRAWGLYVFVPFCAPSFRVQSHTSARTTSQGGQARWIGRRARSLSGHPTLTSSTGTRSDIETIRRHDARKIRQHSINSCCSTANQG